MEHEDFYIDILYFDGTLPTLKHPEEGNSFETLLWNLIVMYNNEDFELITDLKKEFSKSESLLAKFGVEAINFMMNEMAGFCNKHEIKNKFMFDPNTRTRKIKPTTLPIYMYPVLFDNVVSLIWDMVLAEKNKIEKKLFTIELLPKLINAFVKYEDIRKEIDFSTKDSGEIEKAIDIVFSKFPDKVQEYKNGKNNVINMLLGETIRSLGGKCNAKEVKEMLNKKIII